MVWQNGTPWSFSSLVKIVNTDQCKLKQDLQKLKLVMEDLIKERLIIHLAFLFNSPVWSFVELGENEWHLMVHSPNLNVLVPLSKAYTQYYHNIIWITVSIHQLVKCLVIGLARIFWSVSLSTASQVVVGFHLWRDQCTFIWLLKECYNSLSISCDPCRQVLNHIQLSPGIQVWYYFDDITFQGGPFDILIWAIQILTEELTKIDWAIVPQITLDPITSVKFLKMIK